LGCFWWGVLGFVCCGVGGWLLAPECACGKLHN
jgi:hypothetical protein